MSGTRLPLIQSYRPRSFAERGLVAPFTTPMLSGARIRRMPGVATYVGERVVLGQGSHAAAPANPSPQAIAERLRVTALEVVVPNPSGGRGVYILPWGDIGALCRPTLHDVFLGRAIATVLDEPGARLTPARVRAVARQVASQGHAGRMAAQAARSALQSHADGLVATRFTLLMEITEQMEAQGAPARPLVEEGPAEIERRGGMALLQLADQLGQPAQRMADLLDLLAMQFVDIGIGLGMAEASLSRLMVSLGALHHDLVAWAQMEQGLGLDQTKSDAHDALAVAAAAELASRMGRALLDTVRAEVGDMTALMRQAIASPASLFDRCARASWLLDGWEAICLLWQASPSLLARHVALQEIALQVPVLPDEAEAWLGLPLGTADRLFRRPALSNAQAALESQVLERIARNEQLRALAG